MQSIRRKLLLAFGYLLAFPAMAEPLYRREPKLRKAAIGKEGEIRVSPLSLVKAFGQPTDESWDSESLGGYYFASQQNQPFTVYFRAYDLSPKAIARLKATFWTQTEPAEFSIGALSDQGVSEFKVWLQSEASK